jgi:hypothetical protein
MTKFSDFVAQTQKEEAPEGMEISGAFCCQTCNEQCDEAEYFRIEKILRWKCPDGHISYIEDFII